MTRLPLTRSTTGRKWRIQVVTVVESASRYCGDDSCRISSCRDRLRSSAGEKFVGEEVLGYVWKREAVQSSEVCRDLSIRSDEPSEGRERDFRVRSY